MLLNDEIRRADLLKKRILLLQQELQPLETSIKAKTIVSIIEQTTKHFVQNKHMFANNPEQFLLDYITYCLRDANAFIVPNTEGPDFSSSFAGPLASYIKEKKC